MCVTTSPLWPVCQCNVRLSPRPRISPGAANLGLIGIRHVTALRVEATAHKPRIKSALITGFFAAGTRYYKSNFEATA